MQEVHIEVVCCSAEDCSAADAAGANRIEFCSAISLGGITPSAGVLAASRPRTKLPIMAMLRPREGGFVYSEAEFETMCLDAEVLAACGIDGLVFGVLTPENRIDVSRCQTLVSKAGALECVFHRAFDYTPDPFEALEQLIELGFKRVLTSGQSRTALDGVQSICALKDRARGRIEILPGGGIRSTNARDLVQRTGLSALHLAPRRTVPSAGPYGPHDELDPEEILALRAS